MNHLSYGLVRAVRRVHEAAVETKSSQNATPRSSPPRPLASVCPRCNGAGFLRRNLPPNHPDFGRAVACQCIADKLAARRQKRLYQLSNIGMLSRFTFDSFDPQYNPFLSSRQKGKLEEGRQTCRDYAEKPEGWLILTGGYGGGKTHLAAAIANYRLAQGKLTLFVVVPDLLDHLRATYGPRSDVAYDERFEQVRNVPLLILDNLGSQATTPWAQEKLFQIINHRYNAQMPTVITTNQPLEELEIRLRSRLMDSRISQVITLGGTLLGTSEKESDTGDLSTLPLLEHMTFDRFDLSAEGLNQVEHEWLQHAYNVCRTFAQEPGGWLLLTGDYGTGKTHLAAAIANAQQKLGIQALFVVVPDLLDHLRAAYNPQSPISYDARFEQIRRAPLLVLDDLGTQTATRWASEKLFQLFNYRYMAQLPTIVTLNSIKQIEPRLRERMMEMTEVGHGSLIDLQLPPYRSRVGNRRQNAGYSANRKRYG